VTTLRGGSLGYAEIVAVKVFTKSLRAFNTQQIILSQINSVALITFFTRTFLFASLVLIFAVVY
jgi:hypothetical protein